MNALVLSGGGALGAYEAGVAQALLERERYDVICGVSIGAINAALIAAGKTDDALRRFWHDEFPAQAPHLFPHVPRLRRLLGHLRSFGSGGAWQDAVHVAGAATELPFLRKLGELHKASLPALAASLGAMVDFSQLHTSLLVGATNMTHARAAVFRAFVGEAPEPTYHPRMIEYHDLTEDNFVMALIASSAMPGLLSQIELSLGGKPALYADGCLVHTSPLGLAVNSGATHVTVVFVDQELDHEIAAAAQGFTEQAYNIATLWQQRLLDYELRLAETTNELIRLGGGEGKRQIRIRYVRPNSPLQIDLLAFDDRPALARLFELGVADGRMAPIEKLREPPSGVTADASGSFWESLRRFFPRKSLGRSA